MRKYSRMLLAAFMSIILISTSMITMAEEVLTGTDEPLPAAEETEPAGEALPEEEEEIPQHLNVASATHMNGNFLTGLWGYNTSDLDVQALLQGYNLIIWNGNEGMFITDPSVVSGLTVTENEAGDRTYRISLYDDLYFSDGTPITAWDYAFSWLLLCSEEIGGLGVTPADYSWLMGFEEYQDGTQPYLTGISVLEDDTLLITVKHEALPFFYELGLLSCIPYPIRTIAPGVRVFDDGYGVYLANDPDWEEPEEEEETAAEEQAEGEEPEEQEEEPRFTTELLKETILNPETGYLSHPAVVSGPYLLTSWDGEVAEFEANPFYKGDSAGRFPLLETLTYRCLKNEDMMKALEAGDIDLLNKVTDTETILTGMDLANDDEFSVIDEIRTSGREFEMSNYTRTGLTYISFSRIKEAVASAAVRQAIAWCMDRDEIMSSYTGNFGLRADGYYGLGQWMFRIAIGNTQPTETAPEDENDAAAMAEYEARIAAWEEINLDSLTVYELDLEKARTLLEEDGWLLNEEGLREKDSMVLDLVMVYPEGSRIKDAFEEYLIPNLEKVGIRLSLQPLPMEKLLDLYYGQLETDFTEAEVAETVEELSAAEETIETGSEDVTEEPAENIEPEEIDMFYLGSNLDILFEPEYLYAEYSPRRPLEDMAQYTGGGYVFIDKSELKGSQALQIADELQRELSQAASYMTDNAEECVRKMLDEDTVENAEEHEISETEQLIRDLTEAAMNRIYAPAEVEEETDEGAENNTPENEASENETPEALRLRMLNTYIDIYNDYIEMYRDYGSIYTKAMDMRETQPGDTLEYMQKWLQFQEMINGYLPIIPVYSNVYFDFYISTLKDYTISQNITWGNAILGSYLQESEPQPAEGEESGSEEETDLSDEQASESAEEDGLFDLAG